MICAGTLQRENSPELTESVARKLRLTRKCADSLNLKRGCIKFGKCRAVRDEELILPGVAMECCVAHSKLSK